MQWGMKVRPQLQLVNVVVVLIQLQWMIPTIMKRRRMAIIMMMTMKRIAGAIVMDTTNLILLEHERQMNTSLLV